MKGIVFLGNRKLELREFPDPTPGPGEVVIAIKASGMCGSDLHPYRAIGNAAAALGLGAADVVVIALPLTKATHHLFTRDLFRRMRPSAILVNITRGAIVYGDDLLVALEQGWLWGAGLDVTDPEPLPPGHPLWTHPRVIVTPHTAGGSPRRAGRVIATFCENLRRLRAGQPLLALIDKRKGY